MVDVHHVGKEGLQRLQDTKQTVRKTVSHNRQSDESIDFYMWPIEHNYLNDVKSIPIQYCSIMLRSLAINQDNLQPPYCINAVIV